jgi:hypothetical protein
VGRLIKHGQDSLRCWLGKIFVVESYFVIVEMLLYFSGILINSVKGSVLATLPGLAVLEATLVRLPPDRLGWAWVALLRQLKG